MQIQFLKMDSLGVSQTGSLSNLNSFGRRVIGSSKARANVGRCIMNLTRMESEFYHNVSPRHANLSLSIAISHTSSF